MVTLPDWQFVLMMVSVCVWCLFCAWQHGKSARKRGVAEGYDRGYRDGWNQHGACMRMYDGDVGGVLRSDLWEGPERASDAETH